MTRQRAVSRPLLSRLLVAFPDPVVRLREDETAEALMYRAIGCGGGALGYSDDPKPGQSVAAEARTPKPLLA
jgi:hypothetical protein